MEKLKIIDHFKKRDQQIFRLIETYGFADFNPSQDYFNDLVESIINQQLSNKAAATIWKRFRDLFKPKKITPESVIKMDLNKIRSCGTSNAKAQYIKNIAQAFLDHTITPTKFSQMSDSEIISQLVKVKGVGGWTAEMFLIFSLGRADIFSMGDAGLSKAINIIYGRNRTLTVKQKEKIVSKWSPYRSYACLMLWKSLDNAPVSGL